MPGEMLTVAQAAKRLQMNPQTVRRWIRSGRLPATRIGAKQYRVNAADLEDRMVRPTATQVARRTAAIERLLSLREKLRGREIAISELMAQSRQELEGGSGASRG